MVNQIIIRCEECAHRYTFDLDSDEYNAYHNSECPECGHDNEVDEPIEGEGEDLSAVSLQKFRCPKCEEVYGVRKEFRGTVVCPYCGEKNV